MAVGVRGGTFLNSQAFSPEPSDVGEPLRRFSSSFSSFRFNRSSFVGIMDQMPRPRLIVSAALRGSSVCYGGLMHREYSQHETCCGEGSLCLHAVSVVSTCRGVATAFGYVPCRCTWVVRI